MSLFIDANYRVVRPTAVGRGRRDNGAMDCRPACAACCIAPSISTPIPGMPGGKPAGVRCVQLRPDLRCTLFGDPRRPAVCVSLRPAPSMCGRSPGEAMHRLVRLEFLTRPAS